MIASGLFLCKVIARKGTERTKVSAVLNVSSSFSPMQLGTWTERLPDPWRVLLQSFGWAAPVQTHVELWVRVICTAQIPLAKSKEEVPNAQVYLSVDVQCNAQHFEIFWGLREAQELDRSCDGRFALDNLWRSKIRRCALKSFALPTLDFFNALRHSQHTSAWSSMHSSLALNIISPCKPFGLFSSSYLVTFYQLNFLTSA